VIIKEILEAVREHYLSGYLEVIAEAREGDARIATEVAFEFPDEEGLPVVYRYYRVDLLKLGESDDDHEFVEVNADTHVAFESIRVEHKGLQLVLSPMFWNGVEFHVHPELRDDGPLQSWALRWIDVEGNTEPDDHGLSACIHSTMAPEGGAGATSFSVDFGSAPIESFLELFDVLSECGARSIEVDSRSMFGDGDEDTSTDD
jgi:hypothetical protein